MLMNDRPAFICAFSILFCSTLMDFLLINNNAIKDVTASRISYWEWEETMANTNYSM